MSITPPPAEFEAQARAAGIAFDPGDLDRLGRYVELLLETNTRINLTSDTEPRRFWTRHVLDSLTLLPYIVALEADTVIDVGSGGGLPGMPLAITLPSVAFTLVEATGKKARFLDAAAASLGLGNVTIVHARAEDVGLDHHHHRERYPVVVARAVGPLAVVVELTLPLATVGGMLLAIKGRRAPEEIDGAAEALRALHGRVVATDRTPTGTVVVIEKTRRTPRLYPRRAGEPKRAPLGGKRGRP